MAKRSCVKLVRELPCGSETPESLYRKLCGEGFCFVLESGEQGSGWQSSCLIGLQPYRMLVAWRDYIDAFEPGHSRRIRAEQRDLLDLLQDFLRQDDCWHGDVGGYAGGTVGFLGYNALTRRVSGPSDSSDLLDVPEAVFLFCGIHVAFDQAAGRLWIVARSIDDRWGRDVHARLEDEIDRIIFRLQSPVSQFAATAALGISWPPPCDLTRGQYERAVLRVKQCIHAGEVEKAVLSLGASMPMRVDPLSAFLALRRLNPAPYMFYLRLPYQVHLIGSSPSLLMRVTGRKVEMRPLAGTRPRGADPAEDDRLAREIAVSSKERAEHMMMVDLACNDLKRVCDHGSVRVQSVMDVERHANVIHLASRVTGELLPDLAWTDLARSCFPSGGVSGVPRARAMEMIDEIECHPRGPYGGAVGRIDYSGDAELCVNIRSAFVHGRMAYLRGGGGVVADSDPAAEYEEALHKMKPLVEAIAKSEDAISDAFDA